MDGGVVEEGGPGCGDEGFGWGLGGVVGRGFGGGCSECGRESVEVVAVEFLVGGEGEVVEGVDAGGEHVRGEVLRGVLVEFRWVELMVGLGGGDEGGNAGGWGGGDGGGRVADVGVGPEGGFDLAEFDAVPAEFDLGVAAAEEFEGAIGAVAAEVAGAIPAVAMVVDELGGGEGGVSGVAGGESGAADPELTGDPVGAVVAMVVDDAEALVG